MKHQPARVGGGLRVQPRRNDDGADRGDQRSVKLQQSVLAEFGPVETVGKGGNGGREVEKVEKRRKRWQRWKGEG